MSKLVSRIPAVEGKLKPLVTEVSRDVSGLRQCLLVVFLSLNSTGSSNQKVSRKTEISVHNLDLLKVPNFLLSRTSLDNKFMIYKIYI